jgi:hypothetical protein
MTLLLLSLCLALLCATTAIESFPSLLGTFQGEADWYEFTVDTTKEMGSDIINYKQLTNIVVTEQQGPFFRGKEYYADSSAPNGWAFVADLFGIISRTRTQGLYSVRFNEWLNEPTAQVDKSSETLGVFSGVLDYNSSSSSNKEEQAPFMALEYTGGTRAADKYVYRGVLSFCYTIALSSFLVVCDL